MQSINIGKHTNKLVLIYIMLLFAGCSLTERNHSHYTTYRIPVNAYLLQSEALEIQAQINELELNDVMAAVNLIWKQAGIEFYIRSVQQLPAGNQVNYIQLLGNVKLRTHQELLIALKSTCQIPSHDKRVLNLCITGQLFNYAGGVYFNDDQPLVMWPTLQINTRLLRPAAMAHEFGHFLGLPHNGLSRKHLMQGKGSTMRRHKSYDGIILTEGEIAYARKTASAFN